MDILTARDGAIAAIEFNRPQRRNAITARMYSMLAQALAEAERDASVRVLLVHGKPEVFTAGNDIEDFLQRPSLDENAPVFHFMRTLSEAGKPVVAAVNGPAVGIGTTLLLHCDLVYAGENARFQLPFVSLGLVPEFASSYLLPSIAGYPRAAELLLLGEPFDSQRAFEAGIVTRVVSDPLAAAREAAAKLAALPAKSVRLTKQLMKARHRAAVAEQILTEGEHFRAMLGEPAAREAFSAFLEKRRPDFSKT